MVWGIRVMVYMGSRWRRIHYHQRHLLDYKQEANRDNAAVWPVPLMEKFTNGLSKKQKKTRGKIKFIDTEFVFFI